MRRVSISFALGLFGALMVAFPCSSQDMYYHHVRKNYLQGFADKNIPVFVASCLYPGGKAFMILPMGVRDGRYVELYWP